MENMGKFLKIIIPYEQEGPHTVWVEGFFDSEWGVEVHTVNPYDVEVDRVRDLTINSTTFYFESLNLNKTGYEFLVKFHSDADHANGGYTTQKVSEITKFEIVERPI